MKLSIFGATGFIGKNFCKQFPEHIQIPRDTKSPKSNNILYFISTAHNYNIYDDLTLDVETNINLLCEILKNCKQKDLVFNYISTMHVYGIQKEFPISETSICYPEGMYPITKKCAEDILITFCKKFNVNYRILRLCNVLGFDSNFSPKKNALTWMINQIKKGQDIDLFYGGNFFREVMHVKDVCNAILLICTKGKTNEIYNVGSGEALTLKDLMETSKKILNSKSKINIKHKLPKNSETLETSFWLNTSKLNSLGFRKQFTLHSAIEEITKNYSSEL